MIPSANMVTVILSDPMATRDFQRSRPRERGAADLEAEIAGWLWSQVVDIGRPLVLRKMKVRFWRELGEAQ